MLTTQQVFNRVVKHLRAQGSQAIDKAGHCLYRAQNGKMCAAGCLIHKREYHPDMETVSFELLLDDQRTPTSLVKRLKEHSNIIMRFQRVHDDYQPNQWEKQFQKVAEDYKLKYKAPRVS